MSTSLDALFGGDPDLWVADLPPFQRRTIEELRLAGRSYEEIASDWISVSADNTYRFASVRPAIKTGSFLDSLRNEIRHFLCGDSKYEKERSGLFGESGVARTYVVSAIAVAIAPHLNVGAAVISPVIALLLASLGKVTLNAWCASQKNTGEPSSD